MSLLQLPAPTEQPCPASLPASTYVARHEPANDFRTVLRYALVLFPIVLLSLGFLALVKSLGTLSHGPDAVTFGCDFAMFWSASHVLAAGGNPYVPHVLFRAEHVALLGEGVHTIAAPAVVQVGNPPLFFWLLAPLQRLHFGTATVVWEGVGWVSYAVGVYAALRALGWRRLTVPIAFCLFSPQMVLATVYGNVVQLLAGALLLGFALGRRYPFLAGVLCTFCWFKPSLALPFAALLILFSTRDHRRALAGLAAGSAGFFALTLAALGWSSTPQWLAGMRGYTRDMAAQPAISSASGLYVRWAPSAAQTVLEVLSLLLACGLTFYVWRQWREGTAPFDRIVWLWLVWFLATPYDHYLDEVLLTLPILAILGRDGARIVEGRMLLAVYCLYGGLLLFAAVPHGVQVLPLSVAIAAVLTSPIRLRRFGSGTVVSEQGPATLGAGFRSQSVEV